MKKQLPIGFSDYKRIIDDGYYYIDKTLFIDDLLKYGGLVTLIPRPRRFGKTLNMSMLKYFVEKNEQPHNHLFQDKKIWQIASVREKQGKYPVIFLTFKDIKQSTWEDTRAKLISTIAAEYDRHDYLLQSTVLKEHEKTIFKNICAKIANNAEYEDSLKKLSEFLFNYHKVNPFVLIDEYDAPIHAGFLHDYYPQITEFMRGLMTGVFKDNSYLERGVITGILRTSKEGIFSGLNNLEVLTILDNEMSDKFGFTEQEAFQLLKDYDLVSIQDDFKSWYNGYQMGKTKIYNPWSALNCVNKNGVFDTYWANTSDNALIYKIIAQADADVKKECAILLAGNVIDKIKIEDSMVFPDMLGSPNAVWTLLLFTGYVTLAGSIDKEVGPVSLSLPNKELLRLFKKLVDDLFRKSLGYADVVLLEQALQKADGPLFEELVSKFITQSMSFHDIPAKEIERSYHLFVLGLLVVFSNQYIIKSNREGGDGRFDIMLIPIDKKLPGLIIEFKKKNAKETIEEAANRALEQIKNLKYVTEARAAGVKKVVAFGIACYKKEVLLKQEAL